VLRLVVQVGVGGLGQKSRNPSHNGWVVGDGCGFFGSYRPPTVT
jgi:hypothetical protein